MKEDITFKDEFGNIWNKLYLEHVEKGCIDVKSMTLKEFILFLLKVPNHFPPTFFDKECKRQHCQAFKMRSFDDLLCIVKNYYPDTTVKQLTHEIVTLKYVDYNNMTYRIEYSNCSTMQRIRLRLVYLGSGVNYDDMYTYAYLSQVSKYNSKWSWIQLLNILEIKNNTDFINYKNKKHEEINQF